LKGQIARENGDFYKIMKFVQKTQVSNATLPRNGLNQSSYSLGTSVNTHGSKETGWNMTTMGIQN
jgi:hypothetical protein